MVNPWSSCAGQASQRFEPQSNSHCASGVGFAAPFEGSGLAVFWIPSSVPDAIRCRTAVSVSSASPPSFDRNHPTWNALPSSRRVTNVLDTASPSACKHGCRRMPKWRPHRLRRVPNQRFGRHPRRIGELPKLASRLIQPLLRRLRSTRRAVGERRYLPWVRCPFGGFNLGDRRVGLPPRHLSVPGVSHALNGLLPPKPCGFVSRRIHP